ncbi:MAG TPA: hypothetical protein VFG83_11730, partial [Kofleriaceae bacterium]|nr:hypothetical protein [Kofleriaceae bacterium]
MVATRADAQAVLDESSWRVAHVGGHHLEVVRGGVAAALIWPEGFSQPALARDILARARAGTVAIIGVGTDEQLGAAPWQSAELSAADLVLICLPASRARFLAEL